jgi:hypothetical protein
MKRSLGPQETLFFSLMQLRGQRTVRTGELIAPMGITPKQEEELVTIQHTAACLRLDST